MLAAAVALSGLGAVVPAPQMVTRPQVTVSTKRKKGLFNGMVRPYSGALIGTKGASISVAQAKRTAAKRINRLRHKRALKR